MQDDKKQLLVHIQQKDKNDGELVTRLQRDKDQLLSKAAQDESDLIQIGRERDQLVLQTRQYKEVIQQYQSSEVIYQEKSKQLQQEYDQLLQKLNEKQEDESNALQQTMEERDKVRIKDMKTYTMIDS